MTFSENDLGSFFFFSVSLRSRVSSRSCCLFTCEVRVIFLAVWDPCVLQCHSPGLPGGAAEELCGDAGADAGREGLPGDRLLASEGMGELPQQFFVITNVIQISSKKTEGRFKNSEFYSVLQPAVVRREINREGGGGERVPCHSVAWKPHCLSMYFSP